MGHKVFESCCPSRTHTKTFQLGEKEERDQMI